MFNAFIWQLYKESKQGKRAIEHCSSFSDAFHDFVYLMPFLGLPFVDMQANPGDYPNPHADDINLIRLIRDFAAKARIDNSQQAEELFEKLISSSLHIRFSGQNEATPLTPEEITTDILCVSIGLHLAHPDYFIPYGFTNLFTDLERISELFSLALPPTPGKKDIDGRGRYYAQLNSAFYEFRQSYSLSSGEMCAFLHDFALKSLSENREVLPEPSKVWLMSGGSGNNGDFESLEELVEHEGSSEFWQGNLDTRRGDVLLMYCVSPHSCVHSIWRAATDGFVDPFFHYHSTVWIEQPIKTVPVTFKEMKADPLLSQNGYIRANLQGPSGKPFTVEEYDAILAIMAKKGQDIRFC